MAARDAVVRATLGGVRFWIRRGLEGDARDLARAVVDATADARRAIKRGRRKMLFALDHDGRSYLLKVNDYRGGPRDWFRRSKARREWRRAEAIVERGIETPLFRAIAEDRTPTGRLRRCVAVVERVDGARDLLDCWRNARPDWPEQRRWAHALGALAHRMHAAGVLQRDFAPNNVLVVPHAAGTQLVPIDFERTELVAVGPRQAAATLAKLYRYFYDAPCALWWRFLLSYSEGDAAVARAIARRVTGEVPRLMQRDLAHLRRTAGRVNRRFRRLPTPGGWAHRAIADEDLRAALRGERAERYWQSELLARNAGEALEYWARAQALAQRGGLIAKPLALLAPRAAAASTAHVESVEKGWTLVSTRTAGEAPWGLSRNADDSSLRVLCRRTEALGIGSPEPAQVLSCAASPGARLRMPPR